MTGLGSGLALLATAVPASAGPAPAFMAADGVYRQAASAGRTVPVPSSACRLRYGSDCYGATQLRRAYGLDQLAARGITGKGRTVAVIMPYHQPKIQQAVDGYSAQNGLPRTEVEQIDWGHPRTADPRQKADSEYAEEGALDLEMAHAAAPDAHLIYVATPDAQTSGTHGLSAITRAMRWLVTHRSVDVISMSYGSMEDSFPDQAKKPGDYHLLTRMRGGLNTAAARRVTLVAADGDMGPTGPNYAGTGLYTHRTVSWPASDPLVTAVGGTRLHLTDAGDRTAPDSVWTDTGTGSATGGGLSKVFRRPSWQHRVRGVVGDHRGLGDIAVIGAAESRVWAYSPGFNVLPGQKPGWVRVAGTSVGSPFFAGIVTDAAQQAGHRLGTINPALYRLAATPQRAARAGITDLTAGCTTSHGVTGYCARPGYDLPSGIGTIHNAVPFVTALAHTA